MPADLGEHGDQRRGAAEGAAVDAGVEPAGGIADRFHLQLTAVGRPQEVDHERTDVAADVQHRADAQNRLRLDGGHQDAAGTS